MTVDNNVIKLSKGADGKVKADVVYSAGRNKKVDTINGKTVEYDERDPKGTWKEITEDKYYAPTEEQKLRKGDVDIERAGADIEKVKADTAKIHSDVLTGKISNIEAKAKLAKLAYDAEPEPTIYSTGDMLIPEGLRSMLHYMDEGTKRFGSKANMSPERTRLAAQINGFLNELDAVDKIGATTGGAATGGAATGGGAAKPATTAARPDRHLDGQPGRRGRQRAAARRGAGRPDFRSDAQG